MTRFFIALAALVIFTAQFATPAQAVVNPSPVGKKVCFVHGNFSKASSRGDIAAYEPCGLLNDVNQYSGFRIEPMTGLSLTPIKHGNACYYIGNNSKNAFFIPSGSDNDFQAFLAHTPAGVSVVPCTTPTEVSVQDRCNGLVTSTNAPQYSQGFQAIGMGYVGERRAYNVVSADNQVLRTMIATGTKNGWSFAFSNACPASQTPTQTAAQTAAKPIQVVPTAATPASYRDSGSQRVLINDGVVAPTAQPVATATPTPAVSRVMITDGALVRNIKG